VYIKITSEAILVYTQKKEKLLYHTESYSYIYLTHMQHIFSV
jgi:hypothetical protein